MVLREKEKILETNFFVIFPNVFYSFQNKFQLLDNIKNKF